MALFIDIALLIVFLAVVALAANEWAEDSRPTLGDDHAR
jgi:hypothetical protein